MKLKQSATPSTRSLFDKRVTAIRPENFIDSRGALAELVRTSEYDADMEQVYAVAVAPGQSRGGHYHKRKHEWFAVVAGECHLAMWDAARPTSKHVLSVGPQSECMVVSIAPGIGHTFTNDNGWETAIVIAIASEEYDADDEDTFRVPVVFGKDAHENGDYYDG